MGTKEREIRERKSSRVDRERVDLNRERMRQLVSCSCSVNSIHNIQITNRDMLRFYKGFLRKRNHSFG